MPANSTSLGLRIEPLIPERWPDLEELFGPRGATAGCWCMWFRETAAEFRARSGEPNRQALRAIVGGGEVPGLLAYDGRSPVGWVSLAPREVFPRLARSRAARAIDDEPVWSIVCFFIDRAARGRGVMHALVAGAVDYARAHGARVLEAYPLDPAVASSSPSAAYVGVLAAFQAAGFEEVARHTLGRPTVRLRLV